ncbi:1,4-dihydroxy-2-naphthoate polyprenyltransferase [Metabacillus bambusae]|uniref:1,4-dihydroxy-2-naphthoate octaprenyltransferase n=1 Tax=Metabacillus bambusae TaxID=2795218 RepID=A0ABS3N4B7_9BACI|nr:1,4-dihydroxy-2-naphthoate polyprenyltransferase [Metabacillus bambusae]MBO1513107.1 1,4-dihydroxy-2-naphthoate polyprenyltransferase [Metabacillus bambusae]
MQPQTTPQVPSINQDKGWRIWWKLLRPHTLSAAFIPVTIGTVLALNEGSIKLTLFIAMLIASILIQAATNMFNEYFDYKRGLDNESSVGIGGAIVRNGIKAQTVLYLAIIFLSIATVIGIYICMMSSWWIALIGIVCMAAGYYYTGGPIPIAYTPFGELVAGFFMGTVIILIAYFIQTETFLFTIFLFSVPIAILVGAILTANNIRDLDGDKENGRKTLAILLGRKNSIRFLALMFIASYIITLILVLSGLATFWSLAVLLSIPKAISAVKQFIGKVRPIEMMPAMKATAQTNVQFGFLLALGLFIGHYF